MGVDPAHASVPEVVAVTIDSHPRRLRFPEIAPPIGRPWVRSGSNEGSAYALPVGHVQAFLTPSRHSAVPPAQSHTQLGRSLGSSARPGENGARTKDLAALTMPRLATAIKSKRKYQVHARTSAPRPIEAGRPQAGPRRRDRSGAGAKLAWLGAGASTQSSACLVQAAGSRSPARSGSLVHGSGPFRVERELVRSANGRVVAIPGERVARCCIDAAGRAYHARRRTT
jgi:hypothetical protein